MLQDDDDEDDQDEQRRQQQQDLMDDADLNDLNNDDMVNADDDEDDGMRGGDDDEGDLTLYEMSPAAPLEPLLPVMLHESHQQIQQHPQQQSVIHAAAASQSSGASIATIVSTPLMVSIPVLSISSTQHQNLVPVLRSGPPVSSVPSICIVKRDGGNGNSTNTSIGAITSISNINSLGVKSSERPIIESNKRGVEVEPHQEETRRGVSTTAGDVGEKEARDTLTLDQSAEGQMQQEIRTRMDQGSAVGAVSSDWTQGKQQETTISVQSVDQGTVGLQQTSGGGGTSSSGGGQTLLSCSICNKNFVSVSRLVSHEKTHTKTRPFKCTDCGKSFTVRYSLICHTRVHTRERPYICTACGSRFSQASSLKTHQIYKHTKDFPYDCKICGRGFISPGQRHEHVSRAHMKIPKKKNNSSNRSTKPRSTRATKSSSSVATSTHDNLHDQQQAAQEDLHHQNILGGEDSSNPSTPQMITASCQTHVSLPPGPLF